MQFVVSGYDGHDAEAPARRLAARPAHIELGNKLRDNGRHLYGAAILDDAGNMIGSILIVDFPNRSELDQWLTVEPYITGRVWETVDVRPCRVGPSFQNLRPAA
jgi:uncharacterized protein